MNEDMINEIALTLLEKELDEISDFRGMVNAIEEGVKRYEECDVYHE